MGAFVLELGIIQNFVVKGQMLLSSRDVSRYEAVIPKIINTELALSELFPDATSKVLIIGVIDCLVELARDGKFEAVELALGRMLKTLKITVKERIRDPDAAERRYRSSRRGDAH